MENRHQASDSDPSVPLGPRRSINVGAENVQLTYKKSFTDSSIEGEPLGSVSEIIWGGVSLSCYRVSSGLGPSPQQPEKQQQQQKKLLLKHILHYSMSAF